MVRERRELLKICDSHCHLQDRKFKKDLEAVLSSAKDAGVECIIVPGWDYQSSIQAVQISKEYKSIYAGVGIHPHDAKTYNENIEGEILKSVGEGRVVAIGEIGLDYYRDLSPREIQREVFRKQLEIAEKNDIPVIIHTRDSIYEAIQIASDFNVRGVFHAFDYEVEKAKKIISLGFYIGIGGVVTYKNSRVSESVRRIPLERILLETDAPYLTPHPMRGKRNEPAYTIYVLERIAKMKSVPLEEVADITYQNTKKLFGI